MHLFLSPHLDDAVLSCGGLIHQLVNDGQRVVVRNFMAGDPTPPFPDTPVIRDLHSRWGVDDHPMAMRRREDQAALAVLGVSAEYLSLLDCPYRTDSAGKPLYMTNEDLFGTVHSQDPALTHDMTLPPHVDAVYAPLGAGGHVDHLVVRRLALGLIGQVAIFFYEEYPYSASSGEAARVSYHSDVQKVGAEAVQIALQSLPFALQPRLITITERDLQVKIAAIACYESQISTFWDDVADMEARVRRYALEVAPSGAERLWTRTIEDMTTHE